MNSRMKRVFLTIPFLILFACNNKADKKETESEKDAEASEVYFGYTLTLNAIIKKDDTFIFNYISEYEEGDKFKEKNAIVNKIKGSSEFQAITFIIPDNVFDLKKIRLNFGKNRNQNQVIIKNLVIEKKDNKLTLDLKQIERYFTFSVNYLTIDSNNSKINVFENHGSYNPFILSKGALTSLINKKIINPQ
jgi:YesN/AraC family two-component response regulator